MSKTQVAVEEYFGASLTWRFSTTQLDYWESPGLLLTIAHSLSASFGMANRDQPLIGGVFSIAPYELHRFQFFPQPKMRKYRAFCVQINGIWKARCDILDAIFLTVLKWSDLMQGILLNL